MSEDALVFDRALARQRLTRAIAAGYPDFLLARAAEDLEERLAAVLRRFERAADLGTPLPVAGPVLRAKAETLWRMAESAGRGGRSRRRSRAPAACARPRSTSPPRCWRCTASTTCPAR